MRLSNFHSPSPSLRFYSRLFPSLGGHFKSSRTLIGSNLINNSSTIIQPSKGTTLFKVHVNRLDQNFWISDTLPSPNHESPPSLFPSPMSCYLSSSETLVILGNVGYNQTYMDLYEYSIPQEKWTLIEGANSLETNRPGDRWRASLVPAQGDSKLVLYGGIYSHVSFYDLWIFDRKGKKWTEIDPSNQIYNPLDYFGNKPSSKESDFFPLEFRKTGVTRHVGFSLSPSSEDTTVYFHAAKWKESSETYPLISFDLENLTWSVIPCSFSRTPLREEIDPEKEIEDEEEEELGEGREREIPKKCVSNRGLIVNGIFYLACSAYSPGTLSCLQIRPSNISLVELCKKYFLFHKIEVRF